MVSVFEKVKLRNPGCCLSPQEFHVRKTVDRNNLNYEFYLKHLTLAQDYIIKISDCGNKK